MTLSTKDTERFWSRVAKRDPEECWWWMGYENPNGYGYFGSGGRGQDMLRAHRVAYELSIGPIPTGMQVHHTCRERMCVNPAHLELRPHGTRH